LVRVGLPEFATPLANRFVGYVDPTGEEQLFDITKAEGEAMVQPNSVRDDFLREEVAVSDFVPAIHLLAMERTL
jgi:hypothetical protein